LSKSEANKSTTTPSASLNDSKAIAEKEGPSKSNKANIKQEPGRRRFENREKGLTMTVPEYNSNHENELLLDSGASCHMCQNKNWFKTLNPIPDREIWLGDNSVIHADAEGVIEVLVIDTGGDALKLIISKVLYVTDLGHNLLSCARLASKTSSVNLIKQDAHLSTPKIMTTNSVARPGETIYIGLLMLCLDAVTKLRRLQMLKPFPYGIIDLPTSTNSKSQR
jgi:hypothetical protein